MSQQSTTIVSLVKAADELDFLTPDKKWSDKNGKEFDVEEPTA